MKAFLAESFKTFLIPGSLNLFALGVAASLVLLFMRREAWRWSAALVVVLIVGYLALATPWVVDRLVRHIARYSPITHPSDAHGATAVVVLDGDHRSWRVSEAARLFRLLHPRWVVVSGEPDFRSLLIEAGFPPERLLSEARSRSTREQTVHVGFLLAQHQIDRFVLVASAIHMPRAVKAFWAVGLQAIPSPSEVPHVGSLVAGFGRHQRALALSYEVCYEYLALMYYGMQGWMRASFPEPVPPSTATI